MSNINFATQQFQNTLHTAQPAPDIQCRRRHCPQLGTRCDECIIASTVSAPVLEHRCLLPHRWMCHERRAGPRPSSDEQPGLASDATCESTQNRESKTLQSHRDDGASDTEVWEDDDGLAVWGRVDIMAGPPLGGGRSFYNTRTPTYYPHL